MKKEPELGDLSITWFKKLLKDVVSNNYMQALQDHIKMLRRHNTDYGNPDNTFRICGETSQSIHISQL